MKYKALNNGYDFITEDKLLYTLLKSRGVEDPEKLLNLDKNVVHNGLLFKNMKQGLELLHRYIEKSKKEMVKIHVIKDADVDGDTSAAFIISYIMRIIKQLDLNIAITYSIHEGKEHGIIFDELQDYEFDLLIVPDAASNNVKECRKLNKKSIDILILDHHEIEKDNPYAVVINCMDGEYPNNTLAGVGVVYKFCKEFDKKYKYNFADDYLDLVALGCIADSMDLRNYETRYLVLKGIECFSKNNNFIKEIIEKQEFSLKDEITIWGIGWYIAPYLNAVARVGTMKEKMDTFKALLEENEIREYKPRKSKKNPNPRIENQTLQKFMARVIVNIKSRQDKLVKEGVEKLGEKIKEKNLTENKIMIVNCTNILEKSFTGLVANKLAEAYKRPAIVLRKKEKGKGLYGGSCRNYDLSPIVDLKEFLNKLNTFNQIGGHSNAFGFEISKENLVPTRDKINNILKDVEIEDIYKVDYEIPVGRLKEKHIKQVGKWNNVWGNSLDEPLFAITDIYISAKEIHLLGSKKNIIKFEKRIGSNAITFIKFFTNEEIYNKLILKSKRGLNKSKSKRLKIDIIGKFKVNKWEKTEQPQIEIVDFNSVESKDFIF